MTGESADKPQEESETSAETPGKDGGDQEEETKDIPQEEVTELSKPDESETGDCPEEELGKLKPICSLADKNYNQVSSSIKEIKTSEKILQKFHSRDPSITPDDVEEAKEKFNQAKQSYLQLGKQINDGIKQVYEFAKTYPNDYLIQKIYKTYLAKLLASLETKNPIKPFVQLIAIETFEFEREEIVPTDEEAQRDKTKEILEKERLEGIQAKVIMLEARFQKRQLANQLRHGEKPGKIIEGLIHLIQIDPTDINTYIWLANLLSVELSKQRDQNKRLEIREGILQNCKKAYARIDDYLSLQMVEDLSERDKMRAGYLKTLTAIRKPLLDQS